MNLVELGQRIRGLREKRNLKQRDVANALQISAQAVSKWERGENAPDIAILLDLTKLLGVSTDTLLGRGERMDDTFDATVFCTGLNGFAQRSATMPPRDVAQWANGLFHLVTEAVVRHDGIPIKYVGDGFLGFFSGPNHAIRAVHAALEARRTAPVPDLVITLNSGDIYLGRIGHTEYARTDIIGDTVNTAFLVMHWTAENLKGGLSITETTAALLDKSVRLSRPQAAEIRMLKRKVKVYVPLGERS
ncbi:MAG TPA: helix-turn-helix domain-containing protein [Planctomycetota bacterium]|nr:helix-turn-helix domain-containing protein [Planctomycetota bacterium]